MEVEMLRRPMMFGRVTLAVLMLAVGLLVVGGAALAQGPWTAPAAEKAKKNPLPGGAKVLADAKKLAQINCVTCHGPDGKGTGPAAAALNPKPADWTSKKVQDESDGELFWKISNGRGAMPAWKATLSENDRWTLVHYVRSLKGK
jgi:mono/diheme cytochrome c family protein